MMTGPAQVPGPTVAPSAWASVRLIQGASKANQWQIDSSTTRAQLTVGSDKACDWTVAADRVAAIHFELFWDGRRLWIADTHEAGGVTVDGGRLASWQPITGRARIEFGGAVMVAECSVPAVSVERPSVPPESIDLEPTRRPGRPGPGSGDDDERTTLHVRHESQGGPAGKQRLDDKVPLHAAPTTISEMPEGAAPYGGPPPMPPGSGMSPPAILQPKMPVVAVPTIIAEPGRMPPGFPMPGPAGASMPRPGMGMSTPDPGRPPMMMHPGMPMDPAAAMRPAMPPMMPPPGGPMMTPTGRPAWMDRLGLPKTSVPPRTWGLVILTVAALMFVMFMGGDDKPKRQVARKKADVAAGETGEAKQGETRPAEAGAAATQAGGATTGPGESKPAEGAAAGATPGATQPGEGTTAEGKTAEGKTAEGKTAEGKTAEGKTAEGKTAQGKTAEGKTAEGKTAQGKTAEGKTAVGKTAEGKTAQGKTAEGKTAEAGGQPPEGTALATAAQGADLLLAGRQREALAVYDELARRHPEQQGYAAIVKILKRRLAERCRDNKPGESPCPPAP